MNNRKIVGSNFKTRAIILFIIEKDELRMAASMSKDYLDFVENIKCFSVEDYKFKQGIWFDSSLTSRDMIYWNDPDILIDEVNLYLKNIVFRF